MLSGKAKKAIAIILAAAALVLLVLSVNLVGDGLRDALDPNAGVGEQR